MTPRGEIAPGLLRLIDAMKATGRSFNAALAPAGTDVSVLLLVDNGIGWEAVAERDDGKFDLWYRGRMKADGLDVTEAATFLIDRYQEAKYARVLNRLNVESVH